MHATRLATDAKSPTAKTQVGPLFMKTYMAEIEPRQVPTRMAMVINPKWKVLILLIRSLYLSLKERDRVCCSLTINRWFKLWA
jgi:hypothetical protein